MARTSAQAQDSPIAPDVPMHLIDRIRALRHLDTGPEKFRDAGGPVTLVHIGPARWAPTFAIVTSPQGAHDVLGGFDGSFDKEMTVHVEGRVWVGDNLFNLPHDSWVPHRRALQPLFTKKHVAVYADRIAEVADTMAAEWSEGGSIDLDTETRRLTLRVLGRSLFGTDLSEKSEAVGVPLGQVVQFVGRRALQPIRTPTWLPTRARHRFRVSLAVVTETLDEAMDAARSGAGNGAELIKLFFELTDPVTGRAFSDEKIRDELLAFLFAGHDTTATTLAYSLWQLGRNREMQERVAREAAAIGDRLLRASDIGDLPYTVQIVHESLRICPPAATAARMAMRDVEVDGYRIPAGTNTIVGTYALHHDPSLWDEPEKFDPDRFAPGQSVDRSRWQYLPFGGGPRTCIGDHFAMLEAILGLASVVRKLEVESLHDDFPVKTPFTLVAAGPVPARVGTRAVAA